MNDAKATIRRGRARRSRRIVVAGALALLCGLVPLGARSAQAADVFISEYVEGASNDKAIELHNAGDADVDLGSGGYALSIFFNGSSELGLTLALQGILPAHGVFVLAHGGASSAILSVADQTSGAGLWNGDDAIELRASDLLLDSIGQVGVDPGNQWPGGGADSTLRRRSTICSGDVDPFDPFDAAIQWEVLPSGDVSGLGAHAATCTGETPPVEEPPPEPSVCGAPAVLIHEVQGPGLESPAVGQQVAIEGVVTGDFQGAAGLGGFFLQEEDDQADTDPSTSEGLFVFDAGSLSPVRAGDIVRVSGRVAELNGLTELTSVTSVQTCGAGAAVTPLAMTLPVASSAELERAEGMLVRWPQRLVVSDTYDQARFGEVVLAAARLFQPTQVASPGLSALAVQADNDRARLQLDDGSNVQNPALPPYLGADATLRVGDSIEELTGVLGFGFGSYELHPTGPVVPARDNPRELAPPDTGGRLQVASFNVLNYFMTLDSGDAICGPTGGLDCRGANDAEERERQREKLLQALAGLNASVVGLLELQNDASASIADLVAGLNALLGAGTYQFLDTGTIGSDAIKVGLIYKPEHVSPLGAFAILDSSVDPTFIDTLNRPVLAQSFVEVGTDEVFTVAVNHLKSKGSGCESQGDPDTGDGQGNCNRTRLAAANAELDWLATDPTGSGDPDVLLIGDLNAYAQEDPIVLLTTRGYDDLLERFLGSSAYSYVFQGQSGYLDHALASATLAAQVTGTQEWHINADEPRFLDYNTEFNPPAAFRPNAFRSSDHDPLLVGLSLGARSCQ